MKKINWDEFKNAEKKIAVHCKTEEEAKDFCRKMHEHGMKWRSGESYLKNTNYNMHHERTCYYGSGEYSSCDFAEEYIYKILEWSDYMQKEFTKADLRDGMVVEYKDKAFGRRLVVGDCLIGIDGHCGLDYYDEKLFNEYAELEIVKVYKTIRTNIFEKFIGDNNLELIWERKEPKKMTIEEMREKLEELTGEETEVTA